MNNKRLIKLNFLGRAGELYRKCWASGTPRRGDESLFALFQLDESPKISPVFLDDVYNYMPHYKGFSTNDDTVWLHFALDKPWKFHPYKHTDQRLNAYNIYMKEWRSISRSLSFSRWFKTLAFPVRIDSLFKKLRGYPRQLSFVLRGVRFSMLRRCLNSKKTPVRLYWWQPSHINNFGDIVSRDLIFNLFGRTVEYCDIRDCDIIATGSIMEVAQTAKRKSRLFVWGTGFIRADSGSANLENLVFSAVRGELTKKRALRNVPTGDPGLLINAAYNLKRKRHSKAVGVVIHYADMQLPIVQKFCNDPRFTVISPLDSSENVAKKIAECGMILSSSLHGLIFADSLSIPNIHIKLSNNLTGGDYKFRDYCSGVGKKYSSANIEKIFDDEYLTKIKTSYSPVKNLAKKQRQLVKAFPFK